MPDAIAPIFAAHGQPTPAGANRPLPIIDPGAVWLVTRGHIDIVAMTLIQEEAASDFQRTHLLRIPAGELIFGLRPPSAGRNVLLLAFGSADAEVSHLTVEELAAHAREGDAGRQLLSLIDRWVSAVCALCAVDLAPTGSQNLRPGRESRLEAGQCGQPQSGVLWVRLLEGSARFMGQDGPCEIRAPAGDDEAMVFPLGKDGWLTATSPCRLTSYPSSAIEPGEAVWRGLDAFHRALDALIDLQRMREHQRDRQRLVAKSAATRSALAGAFEELGALLNRREAAQAASVEGRDALLAACRLVGGRLGIEVRAPERRAARAGEVAPNPLEAIARASGCTLRRVSLPADWHRRDGGPLLGFLDGGDTPVALLPRSPTSYVLHNPADGTQRPVTARMAAALDPSAFTFYRTLPERPLRGVDLVRFASRGVGRDLATVALMGAAGGLLALATPLAIGALYDTIIPHSERGQLAMLTLGLVVAALATAAFQVTRNIALTRVQHRAGTALQAAVWHRLISLPARFFTRYSAGDLALRAMGIDTIMTELSTGTITTIVSSIFSLFSLALLFYYSPSAAVVALGLVLVLVGVVVVCGVLRARHAAALEEIRGKMASLLLQYMNGISKIRVAAAEDRAFAQWAHAFARQTRRVLASRAVGNSLDVVVAAYPVLTYLVLFTVIAGSAAPAIGRAGSGGGVSTGAFLAFLAAFVSLLSSMIELGSTLVASLAVVPVYRRLRPVLEAAPEAGGGKTDPGLLRGRIEVTNISFRYEKDGPPILTGVDLLAEPGEFVAVVGSSGSGKSTLLRILLGFEEPEAGTVAFDGFDAAGLDPRALRRQMGVVLQNGQLLPGDIFTNIVGSAVSLTHRDAWEAARLAGLDKEIEEMPMGMHTMVSEGAGAFSGGQRQRLMIARALVTRPRIVFFDEATSALDNPTQAIVTESLDRLRATRIVVAHRLSTIVNADRIYVLEKGRIVQVGTYEELVKAPGVFYDLVSRQIA
jgi:NHLM bacteriocin system ABC transporter ATP-binding protein